MSSISATGLNLSSFFQGVSDETSSQAAQTSSAANPATQPASTQPVEEGGGHHHHQHDGGEAFGKIEQAVTSALQSAQSNGSADPNQIIQDAITKVLQGGGTSNAQSNGAAPGADPDGDGDAGGTGQADPAGTGTQSFAQMLQAFGVDPQQFHNDFLAAVQAAQGGQVDPSTAFQSFPPGSSINTTG